MYNGVFGSDAASLRSKLGISSKESPRDHFSTIALSYTTIAEAASSIRLKEYDDNDFVPVAVIREIVQIISTGIGIQAAKLAEALEIDVLTGHKLSDGPPLRQGQLRDLLTGGGS